MAAISYSFHMKIFVDGLMNLDSIGRMSNSVLRKFGLDLIHAYVVGP